MHDAVDRTTEEALRDLVDTDRLREDVAAFEGLERVSGSDDEWEAAEYVVDRLEAYGIDVELLTADTLISVPENARIEVTTPSSRCIDNAITTSFSASTPAMGVAGELIHLPEVTAESVASSDVDGKIVLTKGFPSPEPVGLLDDAGAAAVVFESVNPEHLYEMIVTPTWGTPPYEERDSIPELPVVQIQQDDAGWLRDRTAGGPVELTVHTSVTTELETLPCPVGRIEGSNSDRYMVVGNHIDSWHEGITDNATAVAATLELARVFADTDPDRGLVFGFWPGHSTGRYAGSAWFVDQEWLDLRENGVAYLHLDLNGLRGADGIWYQHMAELEDEHFDAIDVGTSLPPRDDEGSFLGGDRPGRNSDQSFWGTGLSSVLSGARLEPGTEEGGPVGGGWWWHTPADTRDKVDMDVLTEETQLFATIASRVCNSPALPHDFRETTGEVRDTLSEVEDAAETHFSEIHERLDELDSALSKAYEVVADLDETSDTARLSAAEDLQVNLGNTLIPALYVGGDEYGQEPALPHELLPDLRAAESLPERDGRKNQFTKVTVRRAVNRLCHQIEIATEHTTRFLEQADR